MTYNKTSTCRGCLAVGTLTEYLFSNDFNVMFSSCTNLQISEKDNLPNRLCNSCIKKITEFYEFQKLCLENDAKLKSLNQDLLEIVDTNNFNKVSKCETTDDPLLEIKLVVGELSVSPNKILNLSVEKCDEKALISNKNKQRPVKQYSCTECHKKFKTSARCESHIGTHFGKPEGVCKICKKTFHRWVLLEQHLKIHNPEERSLVCEKCGKTFYSKSSLNSHESVHSEETPYNCHLCQKSFKRKRLLQAHLFRHANIRNHICAQCGTAFVTFAELKKHTLNAHSEVKPFECKICGKSFKIQSYLTGHMHKHTDKNKCNVCGKIFATSTTLKTHKRVHTGEKPFGCDKCDKSFSRKDALLIHVKSCVKI